MLRLTLILLVLTPWCGNGFVVNIQLRSKLGIFPHDYSTSLVRARSPLVLKSKRANDSVGLLDDPATENETKEVAEQIEPVENSVESKTSPLFFDESFIPTLMLCWFVGLLSSLDRVAMSVAILPMAFEYHLTDSIKGQISSIFSIGYGLTIIPIGLLVAIASPRLIMGIGVTLWSLATFGTPFAASFIEVTQTTVDASEIESIATTASFVVSNTTLLLFIRSIMGAAESVVLPATQRILANWVPSSKKSIAVATIFSGFQLGTVSAYLVSPWVIENLGGWRGLFYVYGMIGAVWLIPWVIFSQDRPEHLIEQNSTLHSQYPTKKLNEIEGIDFAESWKNTLTVIKDAPWSTFSKSKAVWAMTIAHAANNWGLYNMLSWTPTFYAEQYDLNVRDSAFLSIFPSIAGAIAGLSAGLIADKVISSYSEDGDFDSKRTNIRKAFQGLALLGPAACLLTLSSNIPESPFTAQALLMGTVGFQAFNAAGYGSSPQEKAGEKWSGLLYSITTLPGVVFGSLGVFLTGQILDATNQNWSQVFSLNAAIDAVGAFAFIALYNSKKEFD